MKQLTLGSLFDGIGGFPLAGEAAGIKTLWSAEIEPSCIAVTKNHFPDVEHLGSVTDIDGAKIPPVDIITFGSPCQDLSIAGKRAGLAGERSGLFSQAIKIIYEMRKSTNGKYPTFIIWENVPGAFNSNKGHDFLQVLRQITKTDISMPQCGKWAKSGMVQCGGVQVAWRQLDAQYWGVPQRRKRIFLVASFGCSCAEQILFKPESVPWNIAQSRQTKEKTSNRTKGSTNFYCYDARGNGDGQISPTITGDHENRITDYTSVVVQSSNEDMLYTYDTTQVTSPTNASNPKANSPCCTLAKSARPPLLCCKGYPLGLKAESTKLYDEVATTLCNGTRPGYCNGVLYAAGFIDRASAESCGIGYEKEKAPTLWSSVLPSVFCIQGKAIGRTDKNAPNGSGINKDKSFTLNTVDKHAVVYALDRANFNQGVNAKIDFSITNDEINSPLVASGPSAIAYEFKRWIVRRLTPTECERLQGFPDRWTETPKIESLSDNEYAFWLGVYKRDKLIRNTQYKTPNKQQLIKWYNKLDCDGNRYKMLGNSLAIPCVFYILNNIAELQERAEK